MNDEIKAAKKRLEAKKKIKDLRKQVKEEKLYLRLGMESPSIRAERKKRELDAEYEATSMDKKQQFLDLMATGMKLGEARDKVGVSLDIACQIILRNVEKFEMFPRKAKV